MPRISRPIGRADLEFYESALVLRTAQAIARRSKQDWDALGRRTRLRWMDRALDVLGEVLGDTHVVDRLPLLAASLTSRR